MKRTKRKFRVLIAKLMVATLILSALAPPAAIAVSAETGTYFNITYEKGDPYFADIDTNHPWYTSVKRLNERRAFGKIRGKNYHLRPYDPAYEEDFVKSLYYMYNKKIGWGDEDYSSGAKKSWQWAESHGLVSNKDKPKRRCSSDWCHDTLDSLSTSINGKLINWIASSKKRTMSRLGIVNDLDFFIRFKAYDPKNL